MARIKKGEKRSTKKQQQDVLDAFSDLANITAACRKANVPRRTFYNWLNDKLFKEKFEDAVKVATGMLEDEAVRRATQGTLEPVFYKGEKVGSIRRYSDTLLIVLLKAHAPEKYRERWTGEISGPGGKPIETMSKPDLSKLTDDELRAIAEMQRKIGVGETPHA